jgi:hypothetical protein
VTLEAFKSLLHRFCEQAVVDDIFVKQDISQWLEDLEFFLNITMEKDREEE